MNTAQHPSTFLHNPTHAHTHAFGFINVYWCLTFEFHSLNMIAGPCGLEGNEKKGHTFMFAISQKIIMFYHFIWMSLTVEEFRNTNSVGRKMKANEKCDHVCICVNNTHGLISGFLFLSFIDTWAWEKKGINNSKTWDFYDAAAMAQGETLVISFFFFFTRLLNKIKTQETMTFSLIELIPILY